MDRPPRNREPTLDLFVDPTRAPGRPGLSTADRAEMLARRYDSLAAAVELLTIGVVLTDRSGRISHANRAARALLASGTALRERDGLLTARHPDSALALRQAIEDAARQDPASTPKHGVPVPIIGTDASMPIAWIFPLATHVRRGARGSMPGDAVAFLRDPSDAASFPSAFLARRFGVTSAECRLLERLVQGLTISQAAAALGTSLTTAKTHLAHLFRKTGTRRQSDLVRLALRSAAPASTRSPTD